MREIPWADAIVVVVLLATGIIASIRWPDHILPDIGVPIAILIVCFLWYRRRRAP